MTFDLELIQPGKLIVATEGNFAPYSMQDREGNLDGIEIRIMREVAKRLGLEYCPVVVDWTDILSGLNAEKYDISSASMDITEERAQLIDFVDAWVESGAQLLVHKDSDLISCSQVQNKRLGMIIDSIWVQLANKFTPHSVATYPNNPLVFEDLVKGNIDAAITDAIVADYAIEQEQLPIRKICGLLKVTQKAWGLKKGKTKLLNSVNKTLADIVADETFARLTYDMLGYSPYPQNPLKSQVNGLEKVSHA